MLHEIVNETLQAMAAAQACQEIEDDRAQVSTEDWDLVVNCTNYSGKHTANLPHPVACGVWCLADGFGTCSVEYIANVLCWDWSHIRDSSSAAIANMANYLRANGFYH